MLAITVEDDHAQVLVRGERIERGEQAVDHRAVVGVVHLGPVERDGCDPARVDAPEYGSGGFRGHARGLSLRNAATSALALMRSISSAVGSCGLSRSAFTMQRKPSGSHLVARNW